MEEDLIFIGFLKSLYDDLIFMTRLRALRPTLHLQGDCDIATWDNEYASAVIYCDLKKRGQRATDVINFFGDYTDRMKFTFIPHHNSDVRNTATKIECDKIDEIRKALEPK